MKDTYATARLFAKDSIRVAILSEHSFMRETFFLLIDEKEKKKLTLSRNVSTYSMTMLDFHLDEPLKLGHSYIVLIPSLGRVPLDVSEFTSFENFDREYFYYKDDLGAKYAKDATIWSIWAPLASKVSLKIIGKDGSISLYPLAKEDRGVWRVRLAGNHLHAKYQYEVTNSEVTTSISDPYGVASDANGKCSYVIDLNRFKEDKYKGSLPTYSSACEAIVYEGNVRDLSADKNTNIDDKGFYKGLSEKGRKTKEGHEAGLDYISSLGITHLQLQPLNDFGSVDENDPSSSYNWGYDPTQYFCPEGSYSSDPNDPEARIRELKGLIESLHARGIRVVVDVVYNHVYENLMSNLEKSTPNFYFRKMPDGACSNSSGCGDDLDSARPMVRKLIFDSCKFWVDFYGIDGFRFDLMGLIDMETIMMVEAYVKKKDPSFLIYGEGWNMYANCQIPMANLNNAKKMPSIGFFNDFYREGVKSYLNGNLEAADSFIYSIAGSVQYYSSFNPMFVLPSQSVNYIECHDNGTFYDFLAKNPTISEEDRLFLVKLGVASVIFSAGMPFIHAGQEIGQTKFGRDNTYNAGDIFNKLDYSLIDKRYELVNFFKDAIKLRKKLSFFSVNDTQKIMEMTLANNLGKGIEFIYRPLEGTSPYKEVSFLYNPTSEPLTHSYDEDREILFTGGGLAEGVEVKVKNAIVPKRSLLVLAKKN